MTFTSTALTVVPADHVTACCWNTAQRTPADRSANAAVGPSVAGFTDQLVYSTADSRLQIKVQPAKPTQRV